MKIVVTGAGGFLGSRLIRTLLDRGGVPGLAQPLSHLIALDANPPALPYDPRLTTVVGDVGDRALLESALAEADLVYHLAAVVSAAAEADFDLGMRVNLDATRTLLEVLRETGRCPQLVFASSVAVYGGRLPDPVPDEVPLMPESSYGTQKAIGELLVADYSRKGFIDGVSLRLPTVVVRPGAPNRAASAFASSIIREPLSGRTAICPVPPEVALYVTSPQQAVAALLRAPTLPRTQLPAGRAFVLPGLTVTVAEMLEALRQVGGEAARARVRLEPDEAIARIVRSWPARFEAGIARSLGLAADPDFATIVRAFVAEELGGQVAS